MLISKFAMPITSMQVIGIVEDKKCFSILTFMKSKFCSRLTTHLPFVVHMFAQHFYILYIISHTNSALSNGMVPMTVIIMMAKVQ
jgi:hypothetical protein